MKRYLPFAIIVLVGASAVASGTFIYRTKRAELAALSPAAPSANTATASAAGAKPAHTRGDLKATVLLEEFGDFECPPCEMIAPVLNKLEHDYGNKVRVVFRQFPLAMHPHAMRAACSAEAAALQGRFWEMHEVLYRNRAAWAGKANDAPARFDEYARDLGLDLDRFKRDVESEAVKARIRADQERGTSLGVHSTPTIFINNHVLPPSSLSETGLRSAIDDALAGRTPPPQASPTPIPGAAGHDFEAMKGHVSSVPSGHRARTIIFSLAALLALAGVAETTYLTATTLAGAHVVCVSGTGCSEVLQSAYAKVGRIPLAALGGIAYFSAFSFAVLAAFGYRRAPELLGLIVGLMFLTTLWLLYVQAYILHAFCDYCLLSAALIFLIAGVLIAVPRRA